MHMYQSAPAIPYKAKTVWFVQQCWLCSHSNSLSVLVPCTECLYTLKVETAVDTILVEFYLLLLFNGSVTIASQAHVV